MTLPGVAMALALQCDCTPSWQVWESTRLTVRCCRGPAMVYPGLNYSRGMTRYGHCPTTRIGLNLDTVAPDVNTISRPNCQSAPAETNSFLDCGNDDPCTQQETFYAALCAC